jgi:uncharacterized protein YydD (DUF2326 family)
VNVQTSEALGTFRADLRRVETTLGARFEARVSASEAMLRDEILKEIRQLREEMAEFRAELGERLRLHAEDLRRHVDVASADDRARA